MGLVDFFKKIEPDKKKSPVLHTLYDAVFTFAYSPNSTTKGGVHMRDGMDLKRLMVQVVLAMQLCYLFGMYNVGHQHFLAAGQYTDLLSGFHLKLFYGISKMLPIFIVTHLVGLGIEIFYAARKGHAVEEGFLVSGALIPLIMPPDIPLWILAVAVAFAVILGKEAFGGTGMNIWNIALLARVFVFFAYPLDIAGDEVWVSGYESMAAGTQAEYGWGIKYLLNPLFELFGWSTYDAANTQIISSVGVDGFTGATPLALAKEGGWSNVTKFYSPSQMFWGVIPGSVGETCKPAILFGAIILMFKGVASWRIIISMFVGGVFMALLLNLWGANDYMDVPWYAHIYMGSFLFAMAFMATDPVTAASTNLGKIIYGFLIGMVGIIVRVLNPAYPEGWMLAILFMNTFAPLIDHYVLQFNISKRLKRAA